MSVAKTSTAKVGVGGRKTPFRTTRGGVAVEETVYVEKAPPPDANGRALEITYVRDGAIEPSVLGPAGVAAARAHHRVAVAELPANALRLSRGEPAIPTVYR